MFFPPSSLSLEHMMATGKFRSPTDSSHEINIINEAISEGSHESGSTEKELRSVDASQTLSSKARGADSVEQLLTDDDLIWRPMAKRRAETVDVQIVAALPQLMKLTLQHL